MSEFIFPYNWSNPNIGDEALILNVLHRGIFEDLCVLCIKFGVDVVEEKMFKMKADELTKKMLERSFNNIRRGFARVKS